MTPEVPDYSSPCIRVYTLDLATDVCMGCFRTLDEISFWTRFSNAEREAIRAALPERKRQFDRRSPPTGTGKEEGG